jgi:hypothetical protein
MDDATVIFNLPWHHEFIGIHHDAHPFTIGRKPKIQDGQATLGGNRNADFVAQLQPAAGTEFLFGKEVVRPVISGFFSRRPQDAR